MKKHCELLDVLRLLAILLVLNSHFDPLYPIPALATGGALGNGLFFIISGYCLTIKPHFVQHIFRRICRLYPGVFISVTIQLLLGFRSISGLFDFINQYIWPTAFWFVGALILFDILLYVLDKINFTKHFKLFSILFLLIYFFAYWIIVDKTVWSVEAAGLSTPAQCFKLIYCFYIYALGYFLKKEKKNYTSYHRVSFFVFSVFLFIFSFAFKFVLSKWSTAMPFQFITQFIVIAFTYGALIASILYEERYIHYVHPTVRHVISILSSISLEMYLVQFPIIRVFSSTPFPINIVFVLLFTVTFSYVLHRIDRFIFRKIYQSSS